MTFTWDVFRSAWWSLSTEPTCRRAAHWLYLTSVEIVLKYSFPTFKLNRNGTLFNFHSWLRLSNYSQSLHPKFFPSWVFIRVSHCKAYCRDWTFCVVLWLRFCLIKLQPLQTTSRWPLATVAQQIMSLPLKTNWFCYQTWPLLSVTAIPQTKIIILTCGKY